MDPDIPAPSIERDVLPNLNMNSATQSLAPPSIQVKQYNRSDLDAAATVPLPPSSPLRTPYRKPSANNLKTKSVSPHSPSRSPSVASSYRGERQQSTPALVSKRSASSLSTARGGTPQFRRASSNLNPAFPTTNGKMAISEEPPQITASSVAKEYFGKELEAHGSLQSPLVVIVHNSCYGHRFSRPRATKNALATIVERPERIHATLLGASTAYVRLGGRHAEGQHAPRPKHNPQQVQDIPFQIRRTSRNIPLSNPSVAFVHGSKWMEELQIMCDTAEGKLALNGKELVRPIGYGKDESGNALPKLHEGDLYLCKESLAALQGCLGGVCDAVDTVFSFETTKRAFVCIRPPGHHCSSNFPSGFCWLNNVHVGISYAAMNHGLTHAAIIDFDLHHGDGSQNIAWDQNRKAHGAAKNAAAHKKTPIGYYSLHDINSYPCEWGDEEKIQKASLCIENAHGQSIWNVHLEPWKSHEEFWQLYETKYLVLLDKARNFLRHYTAKLRSSGNPQPKAAIFISAGFDASEWEGAGMQRHSVNVPTEFYARFTSDIVKLSYEEDLGVDGRVISVLEGGYSDRALTSGVLSHICGFATGGPVRNTQSAAGVSGNNLQTINQWVSDSTKASHTSYTPHWWALQNLEELEAVVAGRQPPSAKSSKDTTGNYSSPTQASTLKMTEQARERHSLSALQARLSLESEYVPPPPDVDWAVASYELSRVIIPSDRQTLSCTHEELNAEATKARRERQSTFGVPASTAPDERMQLRDRKAKLPPPPPVPSTRVPSRHDNRRTTIAAISDLPDPTMQQFEGVMVRPRRRSSDASSILSNFQNMKLSEDNAPSMPTSYTANDTSRASSVMPEKLTKAVMVKKTRAPPATKPPAKPKSSPRKTKASPPVGSTNGAVGTTSIDNGRFISSGEKRNSLDPSPNGSTDEIDHLTNGVKKISIKLKMSTAEKNAAKERQRAGEDKEKKPRASKKPVVPKTSKIANPGSSVSLEQSAPVQSPPIKAEEQAVSGPLSLPTTSAAQARQEPGMPTSAHVKTFADPGAFDPTVTQAPADRATNMTSITFSEPSRGPAPVIMPHQQGISASETFVPAPIEPVRQITTEPTPTAYPFPPTSGEPQPPAYQIPQAIADPTPARPSSAGVSTPRWTKQDLPVFTASSPIPFSAPSNARTESIPKQEQTDT
ncbi:histone deacetylase [Exophiala xenobiotica]|nr:histone deacetylase [Exophiala xenobiotica]KAK5231497.1 histone deacetylase [Exophiala xenobiotica]KAK5288499.1 histone deacetylase [Exophiala xenobiotica]KAK5476773.1 histone deacetylase [Exophiala xenobiotica]